MWGEDWVKGFEEFYLGLEIEIWFIFNKWWFIFKGKSFKILEFMVEKRDFKSCFFFEIVEKIDC